MKRIAVTLVMILIFRILAITAYAAFPTFIWTEEYRSELYAVEMVADGLAASDDEEIIVFDKLEDAPATPTDIEKKEPVTDAEMNNAADEEEPDSVAQSITSYDIELEVVEDGMEPVETREEEHTTEPAIDEQEEPDDAMIITATNTDEEPDTPLDDISSYVGLE